MKVSQADQPSPSQSGIGAATEKDEDERLSNDETEKEPDNATQGEDETDNEAEVNEEQDNSDSQHKGVNNEDGIIEKKIPQSNKNQTNHKKQAKTFQTKNKRKRFDGNVLTALVPGYKAQMGLTSSSVERIRPQGGLKGMYQKAALEDARKGVQQAKLMASSTATQSSFGGIPDVYRATHAALTVPKKQRQKANRAQAATTAGQGWFSMRPSPMTEALKHDIRLIKNRNYLDPKKFYKSADLSTKKGMVQVGTVVEGAAEFYSSRLTKKQRRSTLMEEIMADPSTSKYAQDKYKKMQEEKLEQHKKWKKRNPNARAKDFIKAKNKK